MQPFPPLPTARRPRALPATAPLRSAARQNNADTPALGSPAADLHLLPSGLQVDVGDAAQLDARILRVRGARWDP